MNKPKSQNLTPGLDYGHSLPPFANGFVDYHFNGLVPERGKTTYGLVVDLGGSQWRWNINFEKLPEVEYAKMLDNPNLTTGQKNLLERLLLVYGDDEYLNSPKVFIAPGFQNLNAGKPNYNLKYDYSVGAMLDMTAGDRDPVATIYWGNETHILEGVAWYEPARTKNASIYGRYDI